MTFSLHEKKIVITREKQQAKVFANLIRQYNGIPYETPLIEIKCLKPISTVNLQDYDWIFFTSANGVHCFFKLGFLPSTPSIAVVGNKTNETLKKYGYEAQFIPSVFTADKMAEEFMKNYYAKKILLVRGNRSRRILMDAFRKNDIDFDTIEVYETTYSNTYEKDFQSLFTEPNMVDFITFTSPSTVDACMEMIKHTSMRNHVLSTTCVCIGTTTADQAKKVGFQEILVPDQFTIEKMIEQMSNYLR